MEFTVVTLTFIFLGLVMGFTAGMVYSATVAGLNSSETEQKRSLLYTTNVAGSFLRESI